MVYFNTKSIEVKGAANRFFLKELFSLYLREKNVWELKSFYKKFSCQKLDALYKDTHKVAGFYSHKPHTITI